MSVRATFKRRVALASEEIRKRRAARLARRRCRGAVFGLSRICRFGAVAAYRNSNGVPAVALDSNCFGYAACAGLLARKT